MKLTLKSAAIWILLILVVWFSDSQPLLVIADGLLLLFLFRFELTITFGGKLTLRMFGKQLWPKNK
jgi:hypothetical protein